MLDKLNHRLKSLFTQSGVGVACTWVSVLRIAVWVGVFMVIGQHWLSQKLTATTTTRADRFFDMQLPFGDPMVFRSGPAASGDMRLAWISGSDAQVLPLDKGDFDLLPLRVRRAMPPEQRRIDILGYVLESQRITESLHCVRNALANDADFVVLSIHPYWSFDVRTPLVRNYMVASAIASNWSYPRTLLPLLFVSEPRDWVRAIFTPSFLALQIQPEFNELLTGQLDQVFAINRTKGRLARKLHEHRLVYYPSRHAYTYWILSGVYERYTKYLPAWMISYASHRDAAKMTNAPYNELMLNSIITALTHSNAAAFLYITPLSDTELAKPGISELVARRAKYLEDRVKSLDINHRIDVLGEFPDTWRDELKFLINRDGQEDYAHLADREHVGDATGQLPNFMAHRILKKLADVRKRHAN